MRTGLVVSLLGAAVYLMGAVLPWQTFGLAEVSATALDLGLGGVLASLSALGVAAFCLLGLVTGRRARAASVSVALGVVALAWLLYSKVDPFQGFGVMLGEEASGSLGFGLGFVGGLLMVGGALMVRATLPPWDASTPSVRILALRRGRVEAERILYEPGRVHLRDLAPVSGLVSVSREGDVVVSSPLRMRLNDAPVPARANSARARVEHGDRLRICGEHDLEVEVHHLAPLEGRAASPLLAKSEIWAFAALTLLVQGSVLAAPILGWTATPQREAGMCQTNRCPGVLTETKVDVTDLELPEPTRPDDAPSETSSKAAGGPEGRFGDERVTEPLVTKVPHVEGPLVERVDPRKVGILAVVGEVRDGDATALAEVLRGDVGATQARLAAAMDGRDGELVLGPGTNGLSFQGDGEGGPGDGTGRVLSQGDIDSGGPGIRTSLGDPRPRKVGDLALGSPSTQGYCKQSSIVSVVNRRKAAIRACYEKSLQVRPNLQGKVTVRWTIGLDGKVQSATTMGDTLGDAATTQCITSWVRRMNFEAPDGGMCVVQWPFVFSNR